MFQWDINQIEMHTFHQQVGSNQNLLFGRIGEYGGIVAYTVLARFILQFNAFGKAADKTELTEA
jgi:hypothetical protein